MQHEGHRRERVHADQGRQRVPAGEQRGGRGQTWEQARVGVFEEAGAAAARRGGVCVVAPAARRRAERAGGVRQGARRAVPAEPEAGEGGVSAHPSDEALQERRGVERWHAEAVHSDAAAATQAAHVAALHGGCTLPCFFLCFIVLRCGS